MFERILSLFQADAPETRLPEQDARFAIGALLVRAAKADELYLIEETEQIDDVLAHRFKLSLTDAAALREACERLEQTMPDDLGAAPLLRDATSYEEREATILALWEVVFADGREVAPEQALLDQLAASLGVSPEKSKELHDLVLSAQQ